MENAAANSEDDDDDVDDDDDDDDCVEDKDFDNFYYSFLSIRISTYLLIYSRIFYLPILLTHNYLHASPPSFSSINCSGMEMKQSFREVVVNNIKSFLRHGVYHRIVDLYAVYKMDEAFMTLNQGLRTHSDYAEFLGMVMVLVMIIVLCVIDDEDTNDDDDGNDDTNDDDDDNCVTNDDDDDDDDSYTNDDNLYTCISIYDRL